MRTDDLRKAFLDFFASNQHKIIASSSLIPDNDPTLLFTNAGMVQFKDLFLGTAQSRENINRAATAQRCVRAGGKHNDLENVGYTARHHTFFEMLGNFSFGDYFKRDAIHYAWNFITKILAIDPKKLWITVFKDDDEAADIWVKEVGVDRNRISRCGEKDNFWAMGDLGPCGPCSEIFYDHGIAIPGQPPADGVDSGDRFIEIWNLVFMQFERLADGSLIKLPKPSIDTGMGLERIAAVMQGVHDNYDIDIFKFLRTNLLKTLGLDNALCNASKVIVDHLRSSAFLVADGVFPGNEGRSYVLRRIMRRAIRYGAKLHADLPFFYKLVPSLVTAMGAAYPILGQKQQLIIDVFRQEEEQFIRTLDVGLKVLENALTGLKGQIIDGDLVFKLYDTYGFPIDLTEDLARERGLKIDHAGFNAAMMAQKERAKKSSKFGMLPSENLDIKLTTEFTGYQSVANLAIVNGILYNNQPKTSLLLHEHGILLLDNSPFYAESGGQVGDVGEIYNDNGAVFLVEDTQKINNLNCHIGKMVAGELSVGDSVHAKVDVAKRQATCNNHSATHLLHAALRQVLGTHVEQRGSIVEPNRLRFDFTHLKALSQEEIIQVEALVNQKIRDNSNVHTDIMSMEQAKTKGAMALFGEKYGDKVRVLSMGDGFSVELCGGTHVKRTGDIGLFKILSETGIASGVRRIEAVTANSAVDLIYEYEALLKTAADLLKTNFDNIIPKVSQLIETEKALKQEVAALKLQLIQADSDALLAQGQEIAGVKVLALKIENADAKQLRSILDHLKTKLSKFAIALGAVNNNRVNLLVGVSQNLLEQFSAVGLINDIALLVNGKGGGKADLAEAGGSNPEGLKAALEKFYSIIAAKLKDN